MKRRNLVALVSACAILVIGLVAVITGTVITRTSYGREQLRKFIAQQVASRIHGKLYVGKLSGGLLGGVTIDSLAIRDEQDSLFLSTGRISVSYDPRDLIDKRLYLRSLEVEHPVVNLRQYEGGDWNHKRIFRSEGPKGPKAPGRNFGDYIVVQSVQLKNGAFTLTLPWHPDDSLSGVRLDSAIRYNLRRGDKEIVSYRQRDTTYYAHQYHWRGANAKLSRIRLTDPDSNQFGQLFVIEELAVAEHDPPFFFRNVRGSLRRLKDSIWIDLPHFDLPASTGSARGKIVWGSDLPTRYDIAVHADSVSLADVDWVYPTLPTTGGGSTDLRIVNDSSNLHVIEYRLTDMDVRSTKSRLRGNMTFAVGGPVLAVKNLKLEADPVDFDLVRTLNGGPFPTDWQGQLYGTVSGRGGPLNRFVVDAANMTWRDTHVPGAVTQLRGRGELDILFPAYTAFHGFKVDVARLDLRSIEYLFPSFPRLGGTIAGLATLDSSWLDVRFSDADITHQDGEGTPSRLTGAGRVTWGEEFMSYDVDVQAQPLSLTMLSRSYPSLKLKGLVSGPIRARGTVADLALNTTLTGEAGTLTFDGKLDAYPPGFGVTGSGEVTALDAARLVDRPGVKPTRLNGRYVANVTGDSLANLAGSANVALLAGSAFDGFAIAPSTARLRFADGRVAVDSLFLRSTAATVVAEGALGLRPGVTDSLSFRLVVDSLGGLRQYLAAGKPTGTAADSLGGSLMLTGFLTGRVDSLDASGALVGTDLLVRGQRADTVRGRFAVRDALGARAGDVHLGVSNVQVGGIAIDTIGGTLWFAGAESERFSLFARTPNGVIGRTSGTLRRLPTEGTTLLALDTVGLRVGDAAWALASPVHVRRDTTGIFLDALTLTNGAGGRIDVRGTIPAADRVALGFSLDSVPLEDVGRLLQAERPTSGFAWLSGTIAGTRARPEIAVASRAAGVHVGDMSAELLTSRGNYRNGRFDASLDLYRQGVSAVRATASLPVDLTLFSVAMPDDSLRVRVVADSAELGLVEAFVPTLQRGTGRLSAELEVGGTWRHRTYGGRVAVANGAVFVKNLGIELKGIDGTASVLPGRSGRPDVLDLRLHAWSGNGPGNYIDLTGRVDFTDQSNIAFDNLVLTARNFHAMNRRDLASLDVSTVGEGLVLRGRMSAATLSGGVRVDQGIFYLPDRELLRKQLVELDEAGLRAIGDSLTERSRLLLSETPSEFLANLRLEGVQINLGDDVWLRSREANVKLSGALNVRTAAATLTSRERGADARGQSQSAKRRVGFALEGTINADRGTYTLDLGPVQRTFAVQRGTITFQGTTDFNPLVDITALYTVKRPQQQDLGILVRLHGPFYPYPVIDLSSNESFEIAQSDLVSYLVTGQPAFNLTNAEQNQLQAVAMALLPNASAFLAEKLRDQVGSWVDVVQVQWGTTGSEQDLGPNQPTGLSSSVTSVLAGTRIGGEKQISDNLFLSVSAGLCPFTTAGKDYSFASTLGTKVEYRFDPRLSLQAVYEPQESVRLCNEPTARSIVQSPRQFGLSLFRTWHF